MVSDTIILAAGVASIAAALLYGWLVSRSDEGWDWDDELGVTGLLGFGATAIAYALVW